jgi:hypothetical protein
MQSCIAESLDALAAWRGELDPAVARLGRALAEQDLLGATDRALLAALRERLGSETRVLAFVAEFSRGKSELINAIFFADTGQRVLPATPGRTTMCPVELRHDAGAPPIWASGAGNAPTTTTRLSTSAASWRCRPGATLASAFCIRCSGAGWRSSTRQASSSHWSRRCPVWRGTAARSSKTRREARP